MKSYIEKNYSLRGYPRSLEAAKSAVISYSQFGEDLLLQNFLGFLKTDVNYLDIGAYHPIKCSNTYLSYLKGGCGMAVEPNHAFKAEWIRHRHRDTFLNVAVSPSVDGRLFYNMHKNTPGLNFVSSEPCDDKVFKSREIECVSMAALMRKYSSRFDKLDVVSIDCEGLDCELLKAFPFEQTRPKAIIIEDFDGGDDSEIESFLRGHLYVRWAQLRISKLFIDSKLNVSL